MVKLPLSLEQATGIWICFTFYTNFHFVTCLVGVAFRPEKRDVKACALVVCVFVCVCVHGAVHVLMNVCACMCVCACVCVHAYACACMY